MSRGHVVHVVSQPRQKESGTSHAVSFPFPTTLVTSTRQAPSFLLSRYPNPQDLSIEVPVHVDVNSHTRSPIKASAISTGTDAILSSSSLGTPINLGLPLALSDDASTYTPSVSSLTSLAFDPADTPSILSSSSIASSKYSSREATTGDGLTPSTSTRHPLGPQGATITASLTFPSLVISISDSSPSVLFSLFPVLQSATIPTTTTTTSQVTLTMPITTLTLPSVLSTISVIPFPSSSTDASFSTTTTPDPGPSTTTSTPSHSRQTSSTSSTSSTSLTSLPSSSSTSGLSSSTTTSITSDPDPSSSATNVSTTSMHTVPITDTIPGLAPVTSSAGRTSTITTIKVVTATLQGGRTTVVSSVVESRVLSTSGPVSGSRFSHNTGAIIGVAVSATLGVILSAFAVFFSCTRYRSSRGGQSYGRHRRRRRQRNQKEFGSAGAGWRGSVFRRKDVSPIPPGPIFTQRPRSRSRAGLGAGRAPGRMNSSTRILGDHTPDDVEDVEDDEVSWRPPLAEEDDDELGRAEHGGGVGGIGYAYGQGFGHPHADMHGAVGGGVALPTPPESGEGKGKSSLGHSQSWGHASSGHGHTQEPQVRGTGMDSALLPPGSGIPLPLADSGMTTTPAVAQYVAYGYPGPAGGVGMRNLGNVGDVGVGLTPVARFGSHTATWMGMGCEGRPNDVSQVGDEGKQGDGPVSGGVVGRRTTVIGVGGLVTPRTSQGEDLSGSPTVNASAYDTTGSGPGLEWGSGSPPASRGTGDGTWATTRVASTSTSSRSKSIKDVLDLFRTLSSSTQRNSNDSARASVLARPVSALAAAVGGGPNGGGVVTTRPGYDYGAVMRPQQRQMVLERAVGHYQQHPLNQTQMRDGVGHELKPPPPVLLANHEMAVQYSPTSVHPQIHLRSADSSGERADKGFASPGELGTHGHGAEEVENEANEEESLDAGRSVVRDKLLDPYFLSPGGNGSSPNIEGASLRDYVDYSRRIGGMVKNHLISTTTFDTVDPDGASVSVGILADPR